MRQHLSRALTTFILGRRRRHATDDRGSASTEYVLLLVITIGIVTAVGAILTPMIVEAAQGIDLGVAP
jgi:Flp pilus assembly pilin Flp